MKLWTFLRKPTDGLMASGLGFQLGKFLVILGIIIVVAGLAVMGGFKFSWLGFGKLPGDITIKGKHSSFYFPIITCLVLSAVLTVVIWLAAFLTRR
jgi:hypothetical protein